MEWAQLRRVLGTIAWVQSVFNWMGYWRAHLDEAMARGRWSYAAVAALRAVSSLVQLLPAFVARVRRPSSLLHVVPDASLRSWGAVVPMPNSRTVFACGVLPSFTWSLSSTAREAWSARDAVACAARMGSSAEGVDISVDSSSLVGAADGGSSSHATNQALAFFAAWQASGFWVSWSWQRRSLGLQPLADALSEQAADVCSWRLRDVILSYVWDMSGGWSIDITGSASTSSCARYASPSPSESARSALLSGLSPDPAAGWQGTTSSVQIPPSDTAFSLPMWSILPQLWAKWASSPFNLVLIAPAAPDAWWASALQSFRGAASRTLPLPRSSLLPPVAARACDAPDPRPLCAYILRGPAQQRSFPRQPWWRRWMLLACGDIHPLPGPSLWANIARMRSTQASAAEPAQDTHHTAPRRGRDAALLADVMAAKHAQPRHQTLSPFAEIARLRAAAQHLPCPVRSHPPSRPAGPPLGHPFQQTGAPAAAAAAPPHAVPSAAPPTMLTWSLDMLRVAGGMQSSQAASPLGVAPAHAGALRDAVDVSARAANLGSSARVRLPALLRDFITHLRIESHPFSAVEVDACVLHFLQERMKRNPILGMQRVNHAAHCLSDASRIAAASRAAGYDTPAYCGPRTREWARLRGAFDRPEHSAAHPLHLSHIIACRPAPSSPAYPAWCALFVMAIFCLRTGIVFHLYSDMFVEYGDGFLLVWQHTQKRSRADVLDERSLSRVAVISAARHPLLATIIRRSRPNHRLFPSLTADQLSAFVRSHMPHAPPGFDIRVYGARVAADTDATALSLPDDVTCRIFWWKRTQQLMRVYYSGINIRAAFVFCDLRATLSYNHIGPGTFDVTAPSSSIINWSRVAVDVDLPALPPFEALANAYRCVALSYVVMRDNRARARGVRARRELGEVSSSASDSVVSAVSGACCLCAAPITDRLPSGACARRCKAIVCLKCHPNLEVDFLCPAHRAPPRKKAKRV